MPDHRRTAPNQRRLNLAAGTAALLALAAGATDAMAQSAYFVGRGFYEEPAPLIPPRTIAYRLQDRGFTEIARPHFDGTAYIIDATNPSGLRVRLFIDARDGAVLGRQRLDAYDLARRPVRPGYGWTEEDLQPRRPGRDSAALVPPANIPGAVPPPPHAAPAEGRLDAGGPRAAAPEANPYGLNPDAKGKPAPAPRKSARLAPPQKPAAARVSPAAPAPRLDAAEAPKPAAAEPKPGTATVEPPKAPPAAPMPAAHQTPAAEPQAAEAPKPETPAEPAKTAVETKPDAQPETVKAPEPAKAEAPAAGTGKEPAKDATKTEAAKAEPPKAEPGKSEPGKAEQAWHDPPAGERKVRVIEGATVVPRQGEAPTSGTN